LNFFDKFSENTRISNFIKILAVGTALFRADGRADRHDEADNSLRNFVTAPKNIQNSNLFSQKRPCARTMKVKAACGDPQKRKAVLSIGDQ